MLTIERRLHAGVPVGHHRAIVVAMALVMGLRLGVGHYEPLSELPAAMFSPPWFLSSLDGPPSPFVLVSIQLMGVVAALLVVVTRGRRLAPFGVTWLSLLVLAGVQTSAGKILHNDVVILLSAIPFLIPAIRIAPADPETARGESVSGWAQRVAMVVVAIAYCASGLAKLRHSGLAWVTSDNMQWVLYAGARHESSMWPELARFLADHAWMATTIATATVLIEVLFPLALFVRQLRPYLVAGVVALHVGVTVTLGLDYWTWVGAVLILFTALPDRVDQLFRRLARRHDANRLIELGGREPG